MKRILLLVFIAAVAVLTLSSVRIVGEGEVCVAGSGSGRRVLSSGFHLTRPFSGVRKYSLSEAHDFSGAGALRLDTVTRGEPVSYTHLRAHET